MESLLIFVNIILAVVLIISILLQRSEGGASKSDKKFIDIIKNYYR